MISLSAAGGEIPTLTIDQARQLIDTERGLQAHLTELQEWGAELTAEKVKIVKRAMQNEGKLIPTDDEIRIRINKIDINYLEKLPKQERTAFVMDLTAVEKGYLKEQVDARKAAIAAQKAASILASAKE